MKVLITGATGLVGRQIVPSLCARGHQVIVLTRDQKKSKEIFGAGVELIEGDLNRGPVISSKLEDVDGVIHLAGESVAGGRWTEQQKSKILRSRSDLTKNLVESLKSSRKLSVFVSASAIGYYGFDSEDWMQEDHQPGSDFLAQVCVAWEREAIRAKQSKENPVRAVILRTGLVLSAEGGALEKIAAPVKFFLGAPLGSGRQWMSWIHIDDLVRMYIQALEDESFDGVFNAVAPNPVRHQQFMVLLSKKLHRPLFPGIPEKILRFALGEMSELLLTGQRVSAQRALSQGFHFRFPELALAFDDLFTKSSK